MNRNQSFPDNFLWGTASSAYQTEGDNKNSDWYNEEKKQSQLPLNKRKLNTESGSATDFWNKYAIDFSYAEELGINIHRISIEWSRIFPLENEINREAIVRYKAIIHDLKKRNINVMLCLHHFTLPLWVAKQSGFLNRKYILKHFSIYVDLVVKELGNEVDFWLTINEPNIISICSYLLGEFPPFRKNMIEYLYSQKTVFHMHLAAVQIIRKEIPKSKIGLAYAFQHFQPYNKRSLIDIFFSKISFFLLNSLFLNKIKKNESKDNGNKTTLDFFGLNYYTTNYMKGINSLPGRANEDVTDMNWAIYPQGMHDAIDNISKQFAIPILITENGIATKNDNLRIRFINEHLQQVILSIREGKDIIGYMYWSLTDNYEWNSGYSKCFGLIEINYDTQERKLRESGRYYGAIIKRNALLFSD